MSKKIRTSSFSGEESLKPKGWVLIRNAIKKEAASSAA